jgi:hypothetical protein
MCDFVILVFRRMEENPVLRTQIDLSITFTICTYNDVNLVGKPKSTHDNAEQQGQNRVRSKIVGLGSLVLSDV